MDSEKKTTISSLREFPQKKSDIDYSFTKTLRKRSAFSFLKGSLTVESAIALPVFIFAVLIVVMAGEAVRFSGNVNAGLMESAKKLSVYAYAGNRSDLLSKAGGIGGKAVSLTLGKSMTVKELEKSYGGELLSEGGKSGLSFIHSTVMGPDQMIDLNAVWRMKVKFPLPGVQGFRVIDRARIRAFTGYDNTKGRGGAAGEEEMVYVTETGTVYHRDRSCSHLNIHISTTTADAVKGKRNSSGGKYYPCEYCGKESGTLYITEDGDRYHSKISCPGLKRTIHCVKISEVGGRGPCSRCGY
ncbi:MAG: hypothetical protein IJP84_07775 [Lachnospiraceae bacterium]|nr:hypothetical protein [Lachnospiraceae bacterium]